FVVFLRSSNDYKVDATVFAVGWDTEHREPAALAYVKKQVEQMSQNASGKGMRRVWVPGNSTHLQLSGRMRDVLIPPDRIVEVTSGRKHSHFADGRQASGLKTLFSH